MGKHGLFAYKVAAGGKEQTIYFDVLPDPSAALFAQLEQLEGFKGLGDLISSMKNRLLGLGDGAAQYSEVVDSQTVASCIEQATGRSAQAVSKMLAEYIRAIADLQNEFCPICSEPYGQTRPRASFRVCKHTTCSECEPKLQRCPLCNVKHPLPKLAEDWLQMLDNPEELAELLRRGTSTLQSCGGRAPVRSEVLRCEAPLLSLSCVVEILPILERSPTLASKVCWGCTV